MRLYVLVRRDLPWSVRVVQSIHAATELTMKKWHTLASRWGQFGPNVLVLGVDDELELMDWVTRIGEGAVVFTEPDLGDSRTAVAYYGYLNTGPLRLL